MSDFDTKRLVEATRVLCTAPMVLEPGDHFLVINNVCVGVDTSRPVGTAVVPQGAPVEPVEDIRRRLPRRGSAAPVEGQKPAKKKLKRRPGMSKILQPQLLAFLAQQPEPVPCTAIKSAVNDSLSNVWLSLKLLQESGDVVKTRKEVLGRKGKIYTINAYALANRANGADLTAQG